jgi:LmbE family N-acetylglucosaminyl deacetylase
MRDWYKTIYLSPHLDDAALSCGGRIYLETAASHPVLIVTLMAGDPAPDLTLSAFAQELHARWALPQDAVRARRAEDMAACQILGADYLYGSVLDCIYRTDPATSELCYPTWEIVQTTQHPADDAVIAQLVEQFNQLPPADEIVAPLTVGQHLDHRLVRQAAERAFGAARLTYFEDYPYAAVAGALEAVLTLNLQATQIALPETAVAAKVEAIWAYASQRSSFFTDRQDAEDKIHAYSDQVGGERYWQTAKS